MAANPEPISLWTATEVVRGSPMVPRDFLTACAYGRGYIIVGPDGEEWPVIDHGPPKEEPEPPPVPFTGQWNGNIPLGTSGSGYASKGAIISPALSMQIEALAWPVEAVAGATYIGGIYRVNSSFEIEEVVAQSAPQTAPVSGYVIQFTPLPSLPIIGFNSLYAILHTRTDGSGNTSSGLHAGQYDAVGIPMEPMETYARVTSTNPAIGNTLDTGANPFAYLIKWF